MKLDFAKLDRAFNPRCIAVVGDKGELRWTHTELTFKRKLYSVQISPNSIKAIEALGVKNYKSLLDIPEPVDLVIVTVPRTVAPQILEDCIRKGVAAVHYFTAGFTETDTEEGKRLERQLAERAKQANFYIIGPNCLGIFNPSIGLRQASTQYCGPAGSVGFITQSGTHAITFAGQGHLQGVDINKSVSFGNGTVLDSPDFLEYFGHDDGIKVIAMYLEGVRDGRRFLSVLRKVAAKKPVVIWKGGRTIDGSRAVASHTGSLAIDSVVWQSALKQCGAVSVDNLEELLDTVKALLFCTPVRGNRVGVVGNSGGQSVAISDAFGEAGLEVPLLSPESYRELSAFFNLAGASYRNPIDTGASNPGETKHILEILDRDPRIDSLLMLLMPHPMHSIRTIEDIESDISLMIEFRQKTEKPVMVIIPYHYYTAKDIDRVRNVIGRLAAGGVPTFITVEQGARAIKNALTYYQLKERHQ